MSISPDPAGRDDQIHPATPMWNICRGEIRPMKIVILKYQETESMKVLQKDNNGFSGMVFAWFAN